MIVFSVIHTQILLRPNPQKAVLIVLPHFYGFTAGTCVAFIARVGPKIIRLSIGSAFFAFVVAYLVAYIGAIQMVVGGPSTNKNDAHQQSGMELIANGGKKNKKGSKNKNSTKGKKSTGDGKNGITSKLASTAAAATAAAAKAIGGTKTTTMKDIENNNGHSSSSSSNSNEDVAEKKDRVDKPNDVEAAFGPLMVVTACVVSIAHGSNDVSNAVGPFTAIAHIHATGQIPRGGAAPVWVLMCGGVGIVAGLGTYGHKVMATIGEKIAKLTFTRGFAAQIGTALTVLCATQLGLSVSTTHCLIGAITGVALVEGSGGINRETIRKIIMSWIITLPASAILAIACYTPVSIMFGDDSSFGNMNNGGEVVGGLKGNMSSVLTRDW